VAEKNKQHKLVSLGAQRRIDSPSPDDFCQNQADIDNLDLVATFAILLLRNCICDHELFQPALLDDLQRRATQNAVSDDRVDFRGSFLEEALRGQAECSASICHVVDEDGNLALGASDENHPGDLGSLLSLFVEEREIYIEPVGNRCGAVEEGELRDLHGDGTC
jgi:hypothetical protein